MTERANGSPSSFVSPLIHPCCSRALPLWTRQALGSRNFRAFLETSVAHVLPVFVAGSKAAAVEQLAALCDHFEVVE